MNVALQDHFKWLRKEQEGEQGQQQQLDLSFKDGETIKINMKITVLNLIFTLVLCRIHSDFALTLYTIILKNNPFDFLLCR